MGKNIYVHINIPSVEGSTLGDKAERSHFFRGEKSRNVVGKGFFLVSLIDSWCNLGAMNPKNP
jgi:hypothetical protein